MAWIKTANSSFVKKFISMIRRHPERVEHDRIDYYGRDNFYVTFRVRAPNAFAKMFVDSKSGHAGGTIYYKDYETDFHFFTNDLNTDLSPNEKKLSHELYNLIADIHNSRYGREQFVHHVGSSGVWMG